MGTIDRVASDLVRGRGISIDVQKNGSSLGFSRAGASGVVSDDVDKFVRKGLVALLSTL